MAHDTALEAFDIDIELARIAKEKERLRRMLGDDPGRSPPTWLQKDIASLVDRESTLRQKLAAIRQAGDGGQNALLSS